MAEDAAAYCAAQVRRYDRERWLGALFAPDATRPNLLALYAFNLEIAAIRELVREPHMGLIRLQWWRDALAELRGGAPRAHPVCRALLDAGAAGWPETEFEALLRARERDLDDAPFADLDALEEYADATSGALNALALAALGVEDEASVAAARLVGRGWALTGLMRAAAHHARHRRHHLPAASIVGLDLESWFAGRGDARLAAVVASVAARARAVLRDARARGADRRAFPVVCLATLGDRHLDRLARAGNDPFQSAVAAPLPLAPAMLAWARLTGRW